MFCLILDWRSSIFALVAVSALSARRRDSVRIEQAGGDETRAASLAAANVSPSVRLDMTGSGHPG